jgi:undecaprenyl diphosphate synthase
LYLTKKLHNDHEDRVAQSVLKKSGPIPRHIAIIMDGNGRWAKAKSLPRAMGHREGVRSVRDIVEVCGELGVSYLTLYAFSTENWRRPVSEVSMLMRLLVSSLRQELDDLEKNNVRLLTIGDLAKLPAETRDAMEDAKVRTAGNTGLTLVLALSYSGRWDLLESMKSIASDVAAGRTAPGQIDERLIDSRLSTAGIPDPDLLIRTSGEFRISNFLLWQLAYTEIYIGECLWPEFRRKQLYEAIRDFQKRERRFGQTSEQLRSEPSSKNTEIKEPAHAQKNR